MASYTYYFGTKKAETGGLPQIFESILDYHSDFQDSPLNIETLSHKKQKHIMKSLLSNMREDGNCQPTLNNILRMSCHSPYHEGHLGHANKDSVGPPQGPSPRNCYELVWWLPRRSHLCFCLHSDWSGTCVDGRTSPRTSIKNNEW